LPGRAEYQALVAKVSAFAERVQSGQGKWLKCDSGCGGCCHLRRTAWAVELDAIRRYLTTLPQDRLSSLRRRLEDDRVKTGDRCVFLDDDDRCAVYPVRPVICRTHGPAVRLPTADVVWCELNFDGMEPATVMEAISQDSVLDIDLLNRTLALINERFLSTRSQPERDELDSTLRGDT
jgi:uncharacterized protein